MCPSDLLSLAFVASEVSSRVGISHTREGQCGGTIRRMASRLPVQSGIGILNILVIAQFDTAQGVHHVLQTAELDLCHMIDFLAGDLLDVAYQSLLARNQRHRIDFHVLVIDVHERIAGNGNQRTRPAFGLDQHQNRIGPEARDIVYAAVIGGTVTLIGAKNQPSRGRRVGGVGQPVAPIQFAVHPLPGTENGKNQRRHQYRDCA